MDARMPNPAFALAAATGPLFALGDAVRSSGVPAATIELMNLRASQINGCSVCVSTTTSSSLLLSSSRSGWSTCGTG